MDFNKYKRLKKAALGSPTFISFIDKIASSAWWYGVPLWNKRDYEWFYGRIKGGARYADIIG